MTVKLPYLQRIEQLIAWARDVSQQLNIYFGGHLSPNPVKTLTISGTVTATTVTDTNVTSTSLILVVPTNLEARTKHWYIDPADFGINTWQLTHETISATATFSYVIMN